MKLVESGGAGDVGENNRSAINETAGRNWTGLRILDWSVRGACAGTTHLWLLFGLCQYTRKQKEETGGLRDDDSRSPHETESKLLVTQGSHYKVGLVV